MNTEYVWWVVILLLVAGGAIAFLALGQVPAIEDDPEPPELFEPEPGLVAPRTATLVPASDGPTPGSDARGRDRAAPADPRRAAGQGSVVSSTVPEPDEPVSTSETP